MTGAVVATWMLLLSNPGRAGTSGEARATDELLPPAAPAPGGDAAPGSSLTDPPVVADGEVIEVVGDAPLAPERTAERVVGGETLARTPRRSADDLLRLVPGLHMSQHASEGKAQQFFLRGFDAVHGSDLELQVAGIPINEPSNVHGHGYVDIGFVIPEVVGSLHGRKGSFDLGQGPFATAGTVELGLGVVRSLRGQRLTYEAGTTNRHRLLAVVAPADLPEQTFVAVEAMSDGGFGQNRETRRVGGVSQARLELGSSGRSIDLLAAGYAARFGEPGTLPLADYEGGKVGFYESYDLASHGLSARALAAVRIEDQGERHRASAAAWAMWRDLTLSENFTGYLVNPQLGDRRIQRHTVTTLGAQLQLDRDLASRLALVGGAGGRLDLLDQEEDQVDEAGVPWQRNRELGADQGGAHASLGLRGGIGKSLRAELGGRLDAVWIRADDRLDAMATASETAAVLSPRGTVSWWVLPSTSVYAAYGRGLRPPEARSITRPETPPTDADVTRFEGGEPRFTTSDAVELGGRTRHEAVSFGASLFGIWISNEMVFDHISGANLARNATRRLGAEIDVEVAPRDWI